MKVDRTTPENAEANRPSKPRVGGSNPPGRNMNEHENEIVFEITQESDGGFVAECLTEDIFTEADSWDELRKNVTEAVAAYFFDVDAPHRIRLHQVRDELLINS